MDVWNAIRANVKRKFIFFYLSTGLGAAFLQIILYYYQINSVNTLLLESGLTGYEIDQFYETAQLSSKAMNQIGDQKIIGGIQCIQVSDGWCFWCIVWCIGWFCNAFPKCSINVIISSNTC